MRLTVQHWYGFTEGVRRMRAGPLAEDEWERLRKRDTAFGFGSGRDEWIASAHANAALVARSEVVVRLLDQWRAKRLLSVGAGTGALEYLIKTSRPELAVRCGDWGNETVALLRQLFQEADSVERMDLRNPDWVRDPEEVVLLNRVDMEMNDAEWKSLFTKLGHARVKHIVWIPCGLLTATSLLTELRGIAVGVAMRRHLMRSGYLRTPARMLELFSDVYVRREVTPTGDLPTWGLHLKDRG